VFKPLSSSCNGTTVFRYSTAPVGGRTTWQGPDYCSNKRFLTIYGMINSLVYAPFDMDITIKLYIIQLNILFQFVLLVIRFTWHVETLTHFNLFT
jgi:hypothetical protein